MVKLGPLEFSVQTYDREQLAQRHKALPEPGRCADRIEDFFTVLSGGWNNSWEQHSTVVRTMLECLRSEEGDEPRERYVQLPQSSPFWQDHAARPSKVARLRAMEQQQEQQGQEQQHLLAQVQQQAQQQTSGQQPGKQQQQQAPSQRGYSWLWWWRRRPQPLATEAAAAAAAE